ncbi:MAG: hypothetical protein AAFV88_09530 [Planctomycetota bacterium]
MRLSIHARIHGIILGAMLVLPVGCGESDSALEATGEMSDIAIADSESSAAKEANQLSLRLVSGSVPRMEGVNLEEVVSESYATAHLPTQIGPMTRGKIYFKREVFDTLPSTYTMATYTKRYPDHRRSQIQLSISDKLGRSEDDLKLSFKPGEVVDEDKFKTQTVRQFKRGAYYAKESISRYPGGQGYNFGDDATIELSSPRFTIRLQYFAKVRTSDIPSMEELWAVIDDSHLTKLFALPVEDTGEERGAEMEAKFALPSSAALLPASEVARISGYGTVTDEEASHKMPGTDTRHYRADTDKKDLFNGKPVKTLPVTLVVARPEGYDADKRTTENTPRWNMAVIPGLGRDGYSRDYVLKVAQSEMHYRDVVFDHPKAYIELKLTTTKNERAAFDSMDELIEAARVVAANLDKLP